MNVLRTTTLTSRAGCRQRRSAITMVEMLVVVALTVLLMSIIAEVFVLASGTLTHLRAISEMNYKIRTIEGIIRTDLSNRTIREVQPPFERFPGADGIMGTPDDYIVPIGVNPKATTARWIPIGGCAGGTGTAGAGTTGNLVKACGAVSATNIAIATGIAVDTVIGIAGVMRTACAGTIGILVMICGAVTGTNIAIATRIAVDMVIGTIGTGIAWKKTNIEPTMKARRGGA